MLQEGLVISSFFLYIFNHSLKQNLREMCAFFGVLTQTSNMKQAF